MLSYGEDKDYVIIQVNDTISLKINAIKTINYIEINKNNKWIKIPFYNDIDNKYKYYVTVENKKFEFIFINNETIFY